MGASGTSRGCPTRDSEGGESSLGVSFSAFAVGSDRMSRLAAKIDMPVNVRDYETEEESGSEWRRCNNTNAGQRARRSKEQRQIAERNKDTVYSLVDVSASGRVLLCPAEERRAIFGRFQGKRTKHPLRFQNHPGRQSGAIGKLNSLVYMPQFLFHLLLMYFP